MRIYSFSLDSEHELISAVETKDKDEILNALKNCYKEVYKKIPDKYSEIDLYRNLREINHLPNYDCFNMTDDDYIHAICDLLRKFSNFCEDYDILLANYDYDILLAHDDYDDIYY